MKLIHIRILCIVIAMFGHLSDAGCPQPAAVLHSNKIFLRGRKLVQFYCKRGFQMFGNPLMSCVNDKWKGTKPTCVSPGCPIPPSRLHLANGARIMDMGGAVLRHQCYQGYQLNGWSVSICDGSSWNGTFPECIKDQSYPSPAKVEISPPRTISTNNAISVTGDNANQEPRPRQPIFVDEKDSNYKYFQGLIEKGETKTELVHMPLHGPPDEQQNQYMPPNQRRPYIPNQQNPQFMPRNPQYPFYGQNRNQPNFGRSNQPFPGRINPGIPDPNNPNKQDQTNTKLGYGQETQRQLRPPFQQFPNFQNRFPQMFPPNARYPFFMPNQRQRPGYFPRPPFYGYRPNFPRLQNPRLPPNAIPHMNNITGLNSTHIQPANQRNIRGQGYLVNQYRPPQIPRTQSRAGVNSPVVEQQAAIGKSSISTTITPPVRDQIPLSETKLAGSQEVRIDCPPPPRLLRGYTITKPLPEDFPDDDYLYFIEYHCLPGYSLSGSENNSYCLKTGKWSGFVPSCEKDEPVVQPPKGVPQLCASGFEWKMEKCHDIDECSSDNGGCEHKCINFVGGFYCQCNSGYELNEDKMNCTDIDECLVENKCSQACKNTLGSYECICRDGYYLFAQDNRTCLDVNECLTTAANTCSQICINTFGSFECGCEEEYTLADDGVLCVQSCPEGYMMNEEQECVDRDECLETGSCEQMCTNSIGSFICSCQEGYYLTSNQIYCQDVDECESNDHDCDELCRNTPGGYDCVCHEHKVQNERGECVECPSGLFKSLVQSKCTSCPHNSSLHAEGETTSTIANCICFRGYKGNPEMEIPCIDINECDDDNFGCSHDCTNTLGSAFCDCTAGFRLADDQRTCEDINECLNHNGGCEVNCHNFDGGYRCSCNNEDRLLGDGKRCTQKQGHCNALSPMANGRILPNFTCVQQKSPPRERVCLFICNHGFKLVGPRRRKCLENGWSGEETTCVPEEGCAPLTISDDMLVLPSRCATQDNEHGQVCRFQCKQTGHQISGHLTTVCRGNEWSKSTPSCSSDADIILPTINCPANISTDLPPGSSEVAIDIPQPSTNMVLVEKAILGQNSSSNFPAGKTVVKFTSFTNDRSEQASCSITVQVNDREQPMIQRCPGRFVHETEEQFPDVRWQLPLFSDNVGVTQVRWSRIPEGNITFGTYSVTYIASDAAENTAECAFTFEVRRKSESGKNPNECYPPENPTNARLACKPWARGLFCMLKCNRGFVFTSQPPSYICDLGKWSWTPKKTPPTCVDTRASRRIPQRTSTTLRPPVATTTTTARSTRPTTTTTQSTTTRPVRPVVVNHNLKCPRGQVPQTGPRGDSVCVECPSGTYRPKVDAIVTCIPCPPGYYQASNGMGSCEQCPDYSKNRNTYRQRQIAGRSRGFVSQKDCEILPNSNTSSTSSNVSGRRITLINSLRSLRHRRGP